MSTDAFKYKRPFSPDDATEELLQHWQTPDLTQQRQPDNGRTNVFNKSLQPKAPEPLSEAEALTVKPLTADDIEQIRQAAYDEGHAEGKDEGFSKGYTEGREQGAEDGMAQGLAEGKKLGLAQGETELTERLAQLTALIEQLQKPLASIDHQVEQQLLQLSLAMAQAVIAVEVKTNPQVILQALTEATAALPLGQSPCRIKLNPADMATVEQCYGKDNLTERGWQLQAEPAVAQGGCVLDTERSSVDRTVSQRLQSSLEHFIQLQHSAESAESAESADSGAQQEHDTGVAANASAANNEADHGQQ